MFVDEAPTNFKIQSFQRSGTLSLLHSHWVLSGPPDCYAGEGEAQDPLGTEKTAPLFAAWAAGAALALAAAAVEGVFAQLVKKRRRKEEEHSGGAYSTKVCCSRIRNKTHVLKRRTSAGRSGLGDLGGGRHTVLVFVFSAAGGGEGGGGGGREETVCYKVCLFEQFHFGTSPKSPFRRKLEEIIHRLEAIYEEPRKAALHGI